VAESKLADFRQNSNSLSQEVSALLFYSLGVPKFKVSHGWRHAKEQHDLLALWLTKLGVATSSINASFRLAESGHWYQVWVIARTVRECLLVITNTLPNPTLVDEASKLAHEKRKVEAVEIHFAETWADPSQPFADLKQRPTLRELAAPSGWFMGKTTPLTPSDSQQAAFQVMHRLSDYTHAAYPAAMDLFDPSSSYRLAGGQTTTEHSIDEICRLFLDCLSHACILGSFSLKLWSGLLARATSDGMASDKVARFQERYSAINKAYDAIEVLYADAEARLPTPENVVKTLAKAYRQKAKRPHGS
jgi:hypothetical protein